ncbi:MAG: PadR family transcriptional regulator [bacterium]|nr:PadR family transcriptional regulator [bacterium]
MRDRRMQEPGFLILTAVADEPRHGYGIMKEVEIISGGNVKLRAGTLYAALERFVGKGFIEVEREEVVDGRHRRFYRLTEDGRTELNAEAARLAGNARVALQRLNTIAEGGV